MKIKEHYHGTTVELQLSGNLMGGDETTAVHEKVRELIQEGFKHIIVNLADVKWVNSSGLGMMMAALASCKNADGDLRMANVTDKINSLLMITQLTKVFHNYDSVEKAVASYNLK
ncbi:MAG: STAS domain-containing protein [Calditrichaeota bacterium]|nr:STAS domain-containing protein [Calditrichota bacterium]